VKISATRLKQIIKEELFYREFHREGHELQEAEKAKDERISRKIAYLVDKEGKSRDQAVAIAHSMEGRGDLEEASSPSPTHPRGWEPLPHTPSEVGTIVQSLEAEKAIAKHVRRRPPEDRTTAGTQNLDHLDPEGDPEEKFFGDKIDPDEVGLQTMNLTPDQMKRLRELMSRKNK